MLRIALLTCLATSLLCGRLPAEELISWHEDLDEARRISQQYKVPILVHFYGDQCMPCKTLEKNVFTRPEVASTMQRYFVPVRFNATQDRRTAAEFGVHSWPTDVFVGPDGKVLTQGVCNQNANAYLQNLQSVAVMNRDRNAMLASNQPATQAATGAGAPYGRTAAANLQQAAPGRDGAPSPYNNPASGANPYAAQGPVSGLANAGESSLPSPSWAGQSAHGQAASGQATAGPLGPETAARLHRSETALDPTHKDANLPQSASWQTMSANSGTLASAPSIPTSPAPDTAQAATSTTAGAGHRQPVIIENKPGYATLSPSRGSIVENPHFASQAHPEPPAATTDHVAAYSSPQATASASSPSPSTRLPGQLVSHSNAPKNAAAPSQPEASVPALSGFCPVALISGGQWVEGKPEHAVRHRGRVYFLSNPEAVQSFLRSPDAYSPVLSGYDPLIFLSQGRLVEGSVYDGLKDPTQNQILLFATPENKAFFQENFDRLSSELATILAPAQPLTASTPAATLTR